MAIMDDKADIRIVNEGDIAVVEFTEACVSDLDGIALAARVLKKYLDENHPGKLVFDFEKVHFFSSQVLGVILETRAKLLTWEGKVSICSINAQLKRIFSITNLDQVFDFFPDRHNAINSMNTV